MSLSTEETKPYKHQAQVLKELINDKQILLLPSGSGKTHTIAFDVNKKRPKSFLYIIHRNEIITQTIRIFKQVCGSWLDDSQIGILDYTKKQYEKPFLFATIQTLSRDINLEKLDPRIDYLAVDEYHHAAANTYQKILEYFKPKFMVGMTATPYRLDEKDLMSYVNSNIVGNIDLFEGIKKGILAPFHYIGLFDNIDYTDISHQGYSYNIGDLDRKLIIHRRDTAVLKEYQKRIEPEQRQTIGFCNSIDHVNRVTDLFIKNGIKAVGLSFRDSHRTRQQAIEDFKNGRYQVIFTRDLFNEGIDFPECQAIMFLRPTISKVVFFQQLGRGLRKMRGKRNVLVLDFIGNYYRAFEKRKWFLSFKQITGLNVKPRFEYNPDKPIVVFDEQVLKMFDIQQRSQRQDYRIVDLQPIISRLQERLGRQYLSLTDWRRYLGKLAESEIKRLGGFTEFRNKYGIPNYIERNCEFCNKPYKTKYADLKKWNVCSDSCRGKVTWKKVKRIKLNARQQEKIKIVESCPQCGKDYHPYHIAESEKRNALHRRTFCSKACNGRYKYARVERKKRYGDRVETIPIKKVRTLRETEELKNTIITKLKQSKVPLTRKDLRYEIDIHMPVKTMNYYVRMLLDEGKINPDKIADFDTHGNIKKQKKS